MSDVILPALRFRLRKQAKTKDTVSVKDISGQNNEEGLTATKPQHQDYDFLSPYLARRSCIDFLSELIMLRTDEMPWQKQVKTSDFWLLQWIWLRFVCLNGSTISMKTQALHGTPWRAATLAEGRKRLRLRRGQTYYKHVNNSNSKALNFTDGEVLAVFQQTSTMTSSSWI